MKPHYRCAKRLDDEITVLRERYIPCLCPKCGGTSEEPWALAYHRALTMAVEWNKTVKVGDEIIYLSHPGAEPQRFKTRHEADVLGGHMAVVWLEGKRGCVAVDACRPVGELIPR